MDHGLAREADHREAAAKRALEVGLEASGERRAADARERARRSSATTASTSGSGAQMWSTRLAPPGRARYAYQPIGFPLRLTRRSSSAPNDRLDLGEELVQIGLVVVDVEVEPPGHRGQVLGHARRVGRLAPHLGRGARECPGQQSRARGLNRDRGDREHLARRGSPKLCGRDAAGPAKTASAPASSRRSADGRGAPRRSARFAPRCSVGLSVQVRSWSPDSRRRSRSAPAGPARRSAETTRCAQQIPLRSRSPNRSRAWLGPDEPEQLALLADCHQRCELRLRPRGVD